METFLSSYQERIQEIVHIAHELLINTAYINVKACVRNIEGINVNIVGEGAYVYLLPNGEKIKDIDDKFYHLYKLTRL